MCHDVTESKVMPFTNYSQLQQVKFIIVDFERTVPMLVVERDENRPFPL